jgi:solute carrier family 50 protein (sugar transporter)
MLGSLGEFNPLPSTMFLLNSIAWLFYGWLIKNIFIIIMKIVLVIINLQLTLRSYKMASEDVRLQMEGAIHVSIVILLLFYVLFYYDVSPNHLLTAFGSVCLVFNLLIFVAPFSTIRKVVATRDATPIYIPFAAMGFLGSFFWFIYGLVIDEIPLIVPNALGCVLNIFQLILCFSCARKNIGDTDGHGEMVNSNAKSCEVLTKDSSV